MAVTDATSAAGSLDRADRVRRVDDGLHVPAVEAVAGQAPPVVGEHTAVRPAHRSLALI